MRKAFMLTVMLILMVSPMLVAQHGQSDVPVKPETTKFVFGANLEGDVLTVESLARLESRAPIGVIAGYVRGITGEVVIWLDSIMVVEAEAPEEEQPEEGMAEEMMEEPVVEDSAADMEMAETEDTTEMSEEEPADTIRTVHVEPPAGYKRPLASFEAPLENLSTGSEARDQLLKSEDYLNVAENTEAFFELTGIEAPSSFKLIDGQEVSLTGSGQLTLGGITKPISNVRIFMTYIKEKPITRNNTGIPGDILHINAELSFKLSDYGIVIKSENLLTLDDLVSVKFDGFGTTVQPTAEAE